MKTYLGAFFDKADTGSIIHLAAIVVVPTITIIAMVGLVYLVSRLSSIVKLRSGPKIRNCLSQTGVFLKGGI